MFTEVRREDAALTRRLLPGSDGLFQACGVIRFYSATTQMLVLYINCSFFWSF